jgi:hypothetical protein
MLSSIICVRRRPTILISIVRNVHVIPVEIVRMIVDVDQELDIGVIVAVMECMVFVEHVSSIRIIHQT